MHPLWDVAFSRIVCWVYQHPETGRIDCRVPFHLTREYDMCRFVASTWSEGMKVIAVDVGHSSDGNTCGLCVRNNGISSPEPSSSVGRLVDRLGPLLDASENTLLVLEAPLSMAYSKEGNPKYRDGDFERGHGWWYSAGAEVLLGALRILSQVNQYFTENKSERQIKIAEAFYTRADGRDMTHKEVAKLIAERVSQVRPKVLEKDARPICNLISGTPNVYIC